MANKYLLKNMRLSEISLVDKGANVGARVVLAKRDVYKMIHEEDGKFVVYSMDGKKLGTHETMADAEAQLAVIEAEKSAHEEADLVLPEWVGKVGAKISAARMEKIKAMYQMLGDMMAEQGQGPMQKHVNMEDVMKMDLSTLAPEVQAHIAALESAVVKAGVEAQEAIAKALAKPLTDEEVMKAQPEAIQKAFAVLQKKADESDAIAKAEREARLSKVYQDEADSYNALPIDQSKDASLLRALDEKLSKEEAARVREILKAADAGMFTAGIFKEIGVGGEESGGAEGQIEKMAQEKLAKGLVKTMSQAIALVMQERPDLYDETVEGR